MAYNIPYESDYEEWYGAPQNVTRISATLVQTKNADGIMVGRLSASWDIPDNGGTFNVLTSTDGVDFYMARSGIVGNSVTLDVEPNTAYYLKVITVLGASESTGTVSDLIGVGSIPTPPTPTVTVMPGGLQINVGYILPDYSVDIVIGDETINTKQLIANYLCGNGTYTVKTAYRDAFGNIGSYSTTVTVTKGADYNVRPGDTITDTTLIALITGQQSVSINGETYYFVKLDDGTYYYNNAYHTITIDDDWEIAIAENDYKVFNLKTPLLNGYVIADDGGDYYIAEANKVILKHRTSYFTKYNSLPALAGVFQRADVGVGYRTPILVSTIADAVKMQNSGEEVWSSAGSFEDANHVTWYYCAITNSNYGWDEAVVEQNYPTINYRGVNIANAAKQLLTEADPTLIPVGVVEENLFYPTDYTLASGDTISDNTLKSLIVYHRPISVNGTTFLPYSYSNGTYTYYAINNGTATEILKASINSSWVITITKEDTGGAVASVNGQTGTVVLDTDDISEGSTNLYYTAQRFNTAFDNKAGDADDLAAGVDTDNHSWSAKTLHDYLQGTATFELDANGDIQPCADPKPSLFWDIDTNGDIMPSAQVWWQSANGNLIPE